MEGRTIYEDIMYDIKEDDVIFGKEELVNAGITDDQLIIFYSEQLVRNTYAIVVDSSPNSFLTDYGFSIVGEFAIPRYVHYLQFREQITKNVKMYWDENRTIKAYTSPFQGRLIYFLATRNGKFLTVVVHTQ